ncbi:hypothetical protein, partial [Streptomyces decoyicus]|uniref:hypothetical protein n=1 Tax=Streptomyces decoyicus TaxID=249567 RepID=UPI0033BA8362
LRGRDGVLVPRVAGVDGVAERVVGDELLLAFSASPDNKGGAFEVGGEYNQSTETTKKWASMDQERREFAVPDGMAGGTFQAHANAGWYTGYIVQKIDNTDGKAEKIVAIPARVLIQAPHDDVPLTWVGRES